MRVRVRLFARAKDLAGGASSVALDLPDGATIGQLRRRLAEEQPALTVLLERSALAVNDEFAVDETTLPPGADVALLPPVSGGCP